MNNESRCIFSEGSVLLPDGYKEQTINILISPTGHVRSISHEMIKQKTYPLKSIFLIKKHCYNVH